MGEVRRGGRWGTHVTREGQKSGKWKTGVGSVVQYRAERPPKREQCVLAMEIVPTKILVLTLLGVLRLFFGLVPLKITKRLHLWGASGVTHKLVETRRRQVDIAITLCLCFGGGVLFATCFIHMIPEVRASLETVRISGGTIIPKESSFPFAELLICIGFFVVYIIEEVAHRLFLHSKEPRDTPSSPSRSSTGTGDIRKVREVNSDVLVFENSASRSHRNGTGSKIGPATSQVHLLVSSLSIDAPSKEVSSTAVLTPVEDAGCCSVELSRPQFVPHEHPESRLHHHHSDIAKDNLGSSVVGNLRSFLVVVALSFHSIFEGLAIGLQPTQRDVWYLFGAVSIHACAILFCIGLELVTSGTRMLQLVLYMVILALVSPLGVLIGLLVTEYSSQDSSSQTLVVACLQGVAGGTILYITFFEVLNREKTKKNGVNGLVKIGFILFGFCIMVALQAIGEYNIQTPSVLLFYADKPHALIPLHIKLNSHVR
uniref:Zinc transporter ZIP1 n=1 Tax=Timema monikensis TaxID=170555 RepID=A0A7R9HLU8_9NEOP|nr:unnamed protein product [Timema monikensis]